ncbi:subtilisin-like protease SBT3.9 [Malania oleifera]|uniref:subtilisin-like protease SBT3.9 n=1 Tax=Malania oleifera TaxID=397392 RepID=UPI0025ADFC62|nr:subtilisin-like protease SBT3.9 [Malania oleifera]
MHSIIFLVLTLQKLSILLAQPSKVYIVYMGDSTHHTPQHIEDSHHELLTNLLGSKEAAKDSILYSYKHGFSGFAAVLTKSQAKQVAGFPRVVRVFPSKMFSLHTTRSWDFLQLEAQVSNEIHKQKSHEGNGVILGFIDTGIWPESKSFKDDNMGAVPSRWKGICQEGEDFNQSHCNNKVIGARWYIKGYEAEYGKMNRSETNEYLSPRDADGHGTHTSSTALGNPVQNASFMGLAQGLARGGAPLAHLSVYKVCWSSGGCGAADILAAFDDAIYDGVDVISISLGSSFPAPYYSDDTMAIASFHAVANGITVVTSAGNSGPIPQRVISNAPWLITVAASTIDRSFLTQITLGNNQTLVGQSIYSGEKMNKFYPLVTGEDVASSDAYEDAKYCEVGALNATLVEGKAVLCFQAYNQSSATIALRAVLEAKGAAVIFAQYPSKDVNKVNSVIPFVQVDNIIGVSLLRYIEITSNPMVMIGPTITKLGEQIAPKVAVFSSRGPSSLNPTILQPHIAAPGVNILAAWPPISPPKSEFNILSGTSMAAPHISGIVAIVKEVHPTWSPAAIKSALVTTAFLTDIYGQSAIAESLPSKQADPFDFGAGFVNLNKAHDPGLIYDAGPSDYLQFLCSSGYNDTEIKMIAGSDAKCQNTANFLLNLNLPSIVVPELKHCVTVSRTVTNVGQVKSFYTAYFDAPPGISVVVRPSFLSFDHTINKLKYKVTLCSRKNVQGQFSFGNLYWVDGCHSVRISIIVRSVIYDSSSDT